MRTVSRADLAASGRGRPRDGDPTTRVPAVRRSWLRAGCFYTVLLAGVSGCSSYDPPVQGDHGSDKYKTDLEKCRSASQESVRLKNADTPWTWIKSPFTGPPEVRAAIRTCMQGKGYVLEKGGS